MNSERYERHERDERHEKAREPKNTRETDDEQRGRRESLSLNLKKIYLILSFRVYRHRIESSNKINPHAMMHFV